MHSLETKLRHELRWSGWAYLTTLRHEFRWSGTAYYASQSGSSGHTPLDGVWALRSSGIFRQLLAAWYYSFIKGFEGRGIGIPWRRIRSLRETRRRWCFAVSDALPRLGTMFLKGSKVGLGTPWRRIRSLPETRR